MICPKCQQQGKKSKVYPGYSASTLMGVQSYYDESGTYVHNDPNITTANFSCSEGHNFSTRSQYGKVNTTIGEDTPPYSSTTKPIEGGISFAAKGNVATFHIIGSTMINPRP